MPATLRPYGLLKEYVAQQSEVSVASGHTIRETLIELGIPVEIVALVTVNDVPQSKDYLLQDDDIVRLLAVIGGG